MKTKETGIDVISLDDVKTLRESRKVRVQFCRSPKFIKNGNAYGEAYVMRPGMRAKLVHVLLGKVTKVVRDGKVVAETTTGETVDGGILEAKQEAAIQTVIES